MTTVVEYRQFADECSRLANAARNASQREFFIALAYLWEKAAHAAEQKIIKHADPAARMGIDLAA